MCGIAGCIARAGEEPDTAAVERMVAALGHRGPDGSGVERVGSVVLGHTRLAIVDLSPAGAQPMRSGEWWLTYNGEIFNHLELRAELGREQWRGGSDTETLLEGLVRWGEAAIPKANGLYAYAAIDRARGRVLFVRDRFGVKPLYLARHRGMLLFASELRALLAAGVSPEPRRDVLAHGLETGWANGPLTPVAAITRVLPGTVVEVALDTLEQTERTWYDPVAHVDPERAAALARAPAQEAERELEGALRGAVHRRLMADVPVGTMCSGGVDSSLITALAAEEQTGFRAFNVAITGDPERDESPYARAVTQSLGVELETLELTPAGFREDFVETAIHLEYPMTHPSSVPMAQIAKAARARGIKVLLSGEGADELLGGYPWLNVTEQADFDAHRPAWKRALLPLRRRGRALPVWPPPGPSQAVNAYEAEVLRAARAAFPADDRGRLEAALATYPRLYLPHLLNRQDKTTMQHSVETRVPFLDPAVVGLAANLPLELKRLPHRKEVLRRIARRLVPASVVDRPKMGFDVAGADYVASAARPEFVADGHLREALGRTREEWAAYWAGVPDWLQLHHWSAEVWVRAVLDGQSRDEVAAALWR